MSKRFKLRIARVLTSFQTCRSKDLLPSISNPLPLSPISPNPSHPPFPPTSSSYSPSSSSSSPPSLIRRRLSSALVSVGCRFLSSSKSNPPSSDTAPPPAPTPSSDFQWHKDDKWHVIAKVPAHHHRRTKISFHHSNSNTCSDDDYFFKRTARDGKRGGGGGSKAKKTTKKKKIKRKKRSFAHRSTLQFRSSSFDGCWFSSSERDCGFLQEETDTLIPSSDEEENKQQRQRESRCPSLARVGVLRRILGEGGKVKESYAVVKRSEDPHGDFRRSMLEMIVEKEMYEREDLEQLLHCFLSLNSRSHHAAIVQAFSEIWDILFKGASSDDDGAGAAMEDGLHL